ncbi:MAG TPA: tetratricopeptide repeat protein, partial [Herpetosiphonaceae bacterium]
MLPPSSSDSSALRQRGIAALQAGDPAQARALLTEALRTDPADPAAWIWLSGAVSEIAERRFCLE